MWPQVLAIKVFIIQSLHMFSLWRLICNELFKTLLMQVSSLAGFIRWYNSNCCTHGNKSVTCKYLVLPSPTLLLKKKQFKNTFSPLKRVKFISNSTTDHLGEQSCIFHKVLHKHSFRVNWWWG